MSERIRIAILVGSTKGRATAVATAVAAELTARGRAAAVVPLDRADAATVAAADALVLCTSTFGSGGVPANAVEFLARLEAGDIPCADVPVGWIGLGDRSFRDTYNGGWRRFERAFRVAGAVGLGEPLLFDAADALLPAADDARRAARIAEWTGSFDAALAARLAPTPRR
ncbi:MAG: flavodoxin domain-containing protein [Siculibacillus sp.]|nr:flavodoxin domain-containing protein [Siculibacillus sp.]